MEKKNLSGTKNPLHASPITPSRKKSVTKAPRDKVEKQTRLSELFGVVKHASTPNQKSPRSKEERAAQKHRLKMLYSLVRRKSGTLGGGGAGGAIYGEITQESFQRVVYALKSQCEFCKDSVFMDIGAGLGKPNFHVSISPGVKLSIGIELVGGRWWQSLCLLDSCLQHKTLTSHANKVFFAHCNVTDLDTFDPVTHVYSFNRGFPPYAMRSIAQSFHASKTAKYFICFDKEKTIVEYGFDVTLVDFIPTKMAGSGEQHRCYVYKRNDLPQDKSSTDGEEGKEEIETKDTKEIPREEKDAAQHTNHTWRLVDPPSELEYAPHVPHAPNYSKGITFLNKGLDAYRKWIQDQIGLERCERRTRTRRQVSYKF